MKLLALATSRPSSLPPSRKLPSPRAPQDSHPGLGLSAQPAVQCRLQGGAGPLALIRALSPAQKGSLLPCHPHSRAQPAQTWLWVRPSRLRCGRDGPQAARPPPPLCCPFSFKASQAWVARGEHGKRGEQGTSPAHLPGSHATSPWATLPTALPRAPPVLSASLSLG